MSKVIVIEETRCMACGACRIECALSHSDARTLDEAVQSGTPLEPRIYVEPIGRFGTPLQCQHCQDAPCIDVCPTKAIGRLADEGPVLLDAEQCIVCRLCLLVCPFGVIELSRTGKAMIKCDLCLERTAVGQDPACVTACPTGALRFQEITEYVRERRRAAARRLANEPQIAGSVAEARHGLCQG